jgi:hypothetical protein
MEGRMPKLKEVNQFAVDIPDVPGALADFVRKMAESSVNFKGLWCFQTGGGMGRIFVIPQNPEKLKKACEKAGYLLSEGTAFFCSGSDKPGVLSKILDKIALNGINLHAVDAISVGDKFGAYLWVNAEDLEKLRRM